MNIEAARHLAFLSFNKEGKQDTEIGNDLPKVT